MPTRRALLAGASASAALLACGGGRAALTTGRRDVREATTTAVGVPSRDGAGVSLTKLLGHRALPMVDPFLMLDEIHSRDPIDFEAGFPMHPHRGFETVSILLGGAFEHRDTLGNHGRITAGGVQWMTAGHGIIHEEMPRADAGEDLWGLQLWVNLPAAKKLMRPRYQDLGAASVPTATAGDARVRVLAGQVGKTRGPVDGIVTRPTLLELDVPAGGRVEHRLDASHAAFIAVVAGELLVGERRAPVSAGTAAVLGQGRDVIATSPAGARALLVAGAPIGEPVARRGPFVMNTQAELEQAIADYRSGRLTDG